MEIKDTFASFFLTCMNPDVFQIMDDGQGFELYLSINKKVTCNLISN